MSSEPKTTWRVECIAPCGRGFGILKTFDERSKALVEAQIMREAYDDIVSIIRIETREFVEEER